MLETVGLEIVVLEIVLEIVGLEIDNSARDSSARNDSSARDSSAEIVVQVELAVRALIMAQCPWYPCRTLKIGHWEHCCVCGHQ